MDKNKGLKKLFNVQYGNGWLGSRSNCGTELVFAIDRKEAREILSRKLNVKLGHVGKTELISHIE